MRGKQCATVHDVLTAPGARTNSGRKFGHVYDVAGLRVLLVGSYAYISGIANDDVNIIYSPLRNVWVSAFSIGVYLQYLTNRKRYEQKTG